MKIFAAIVIAVSLYSKFPSKAQVEADIRKKVRKENIQQTKHSLGKSERWQIIV